MNHISFFDQKPVFSEMPKEKIVLSDTMIVNIFHESFVVSYHNYYTGKSPMYHQDAVVLFRSSNTIRLEITQKGTPDRHTLGYIKGV